MRYPHFSSDANMSLFLIIGVFLLVGLFNAVKMGYIGKKHVPVLIGCGIALAAAIFLLGRIS